MSDSEDVPNDKTRRRTRSVTRAEEICTLQQKVRKSQPDKPCHRPRDSLFSWSSGFQNFTGLINWAFLLLTMSGIRLCLENLLKQVECSSKKKGTKHDNFFFRYGVRVDPVQWFVVLTGRDEGAGVPSIILLSCMLIEQENKIKTLII